MEDAPNDSAPTDAAPPSIDNGIHALSVGWSHACSLRSGALYCWGDDGFGQVTGAASENRLLPTLVSSIGFAEVRAADDHTCARTAERGEILCWGDNAQGQLGQGHEEATVGLVLVPLPGRATALSATDDHACVILEAGELYCWGKNLEGQLGLGETGTPSPGSTPVRVSTFTDWVSVATGQGHTCGVRADGSLWCWGRNAQSQLGQGAAAADQLRSPVRVVIEGSVRMVSATQPGTCAVLEDGSLWCWGQLTSGVVSTPLRVDASSDWQRVERETFHACGIRGSSELACWGRGTEGQLGLGDADDREVPTVVEGSDFVEVDIGRFQSCVRRSDEGVWCSGENDLGQLGLGDLERRFAFEELAFE